MSISIKNILKLLTGFLLLLLGILAIGIVSIFGLGMYGMTGNCDYCSISRLLTSQFLIFAATINALSICLCSFISAGLYLLVPRFASFLQNKKKGYLLVFTASILLFLLMLSFFYLQGL